MVEEMHIDGSDNIQVGGNYMPIAQVVNIYFNNKPFWEDYSVAELKRIIKKCKQNRRKVWFNKFSRISTWGVLIFSIITVILLTNNFTQTLKNLNKADFYGLYVGVGFLAITTLFLAIAAKSARRDRIFTDRNTSTIELCEQIIYERQYY
ncbi:hypothetical protein FHQ26_01490 [Testudinibacter sp. TR-2022]|uniref:hypothetical protein n=1 Tax=Testudinibacter sp. TR-2022 TaxID=2585029 RepID=UPI001119AA85|nr:hypothetical protein [Testudinibacter sp. TR-2022]TNH04503.1 hypothetical protein FHQ22_04505 [Pasteurellaceae bacterium Phil31]TNH11975.1 hypothetical protein FHQ25_01430 [Testudinibacter sp. TR-2022]TNH12720.1 hypothetical protein FHQ26_01490 [Testudinibacter sp. TR-2022]TNH13687.1 hypothetical protein FIA56_06555 [Testudinibacter sp. TR-2022]TNH17231.1 hypothetical protein FHQ23_07255 [Testudinibacter sp. TR-2022]